MQALVAELTSVPSAALTYMPLNTASTSFDTSVLAPSWLPSQLTRDMVSSLSNAMSCTGKQTFTTAGTSASERVSLMYLAPDGMVMLPVNEPHDSFVSADTSSLLAS